MTLRQYLVFMSIGTVVCAAAWFFVILSLDPTQAGFLGFLFFYVSLWLAVFGLFSVVGFLVRWKILKDDEVVFRHVKKTFRQAIIFSSAICLALFLLQLRLLTWWNGILLILLFLALEGVIFTNRRHTPIDYV